MSVLRTLSLAVLAGLALAGCDRPFVPVDPPRVDVLSPSLDTVLTSGRLPLALRATALRRITRVEINGEPATFLAQSEAFLDTLDLEVGVNRLFVEAFDSEGLTGGDTLFAVYLPLVTSELGAFALPEPRADHEATLLATHWVLVTGGVGSDGTVLGSALLIQENGFDYTATPTDGPLTEPRTGHTSLRLPDGRVLIVGGARTTTPRAATDFVTTGELYDPASRSFTPLRFGGVPIERAYHTAQLLVEDGRTFVYLYGGRGPSTLSSVGTRSDVTVLEVRTTAGVDSLINLSPGGAVGAFPALADHMQVPLPPQDGFRRSLAAGTYVDPASADRAPVAFRFLYSPSTFFFPFELFEDSVPTLRTDRTAHAGAVLAPGVALVTGGQTPDGDVLRTLEVFADEAGRFFSGAASSTLRTPRQRHTATLLPSGRILLLGGTHTAGSVLSSAELVFLDLP